MLLRHCSTAILLAVLLTGCYSYRILPKEYRHFTAPAVKETVFVENPGLKRELAVLERSGIYHISNDSSCPVKIRLGKMHERFMCGNGLAGWAILAGQMPLYMPDERTYSFEKITATDSIRVELSLHVAQRFRFWDIFSWKKNFSREAGRALAAGYFNQGAITAAKK